MYGCHKPESVKKSQGTNRINHGGILSINTEKSVYKTRESKFWTSYTGFCDICREFEKEFGRGPIPKSEYCRIKSALKVRSIVIKPRDINRFIQNCKLFGADLDYILNFIDKKYL